MAISITAKTRHVGSADGLTFVTAVGGDGDGTFTPAASSLLIATVASSGANGAPDSLTGHGATWVKIRDTDWGASGNISIWGALAGGSPTDTTVTATFSGTNRTGCIILVDEITGAYVGGTAAQAFGNTAVATGTSGAPAATLGAAGNSLNRVYAGIVMNQSTGSVVPNTDWTGLHPLGVSYSTPNVEARDQWRSDAYDTTPDATLSGTPSWGEVAVEIIEATAGAPQTVTGIVLTETPSLPAAALQHDLTGVTLTITGNAPNGSVEHQLAGATLTIVGNAPNGTVTQIVSITGVVVTITPTLPAAKLQHDLTGVVLTTIPTLPAATLQHRLDGQVLVITVHIASSSSGAKVLQSLYLTGVALTVTPSFPAGSAGVPQQVIGVTYNVGDEYREIYEEYYGGISFPHGAVAKPVRGVVVTITPSFPAAAIHLAGVVNGATLTITPSLPAATTTVRMTGRVLTVTAPTFPVGALQLPVEGVVLTITPTLPAGSLPAQVIGVVVTVTPTLPAGALNPQIVGATHNVGPTFPAGAFVIHMTGVELTVTPNFPAAAVNAIIPDQVDGVPLVIFPSLPVAALQRPVEAVIFTVTPIFPAGALQRPVLGVELTITPSLPVGALTGNLGGVTLTVTPELPVNRLSIPVYGLELTSASPEFPIGIVFPAVRGIELTISVELPPGEVEDRPILIIGHDGPDEGGTWNGEREIVSAEGPRAGGAPSGDVLVLGPRHG